jgi:hypothetical protein
VVGITAVVITVIVCLTNRVSAQQAIAMALGAAVTVFGGLLGLVVPDPWTAWRRGFRQGCETALRCQSGDLNAHDTTPNPHREHDQRSG